MEYFAARCPLRLDRAPALFLVALILLWSGAAFGCEVNRQLEARQFVEQVTNRAGDILKKNADPVNSLKAHILAEIDFDPLAKYAMGRFWYRATIKQRADYKILFRETVSRSLAQQVLRYRTAELKFSRGSVVGANSILLKSTLIITKTKSTHLGWRIAFKDCRPYLADIVRDGVSLITVKREEFRSVISRNGVDGLLTGLRRIASKQAQDTAGSQAQDSREILNRFLLDAAKSGQIIR